MSSTQGPVGMVNIALDSPPRPQGNNKGGRTKQGVWAGSGDGNGTLTATTGNGALKPRQPRGRLPSAASRASAASVALLAAIMGNVLEFYDFSVYAFFAPEIGKLFFPAGSPSARAVRTFTVFAGGFLMRPLGSVLLGAIGDKYGTAAALKWSIALMTIPTVVTGCLPTYAKVGMAAPFLLTACRLLQGLSVGGELIGALLHTSDHSPPNKRGLLCGIVAVFGSMGNLLGSVVSVGMRHALREEQLLSWGWRVPFLTGSLLGVVGILLRTKTHGLYEGEEEGAQGVEERLPLHATEAGAPSLLAVVGEGMSPAVLEEDRTLDYRTRHHHHDMRGEGWAHGQQQQEQSQPQSQPSPSLAAAAAAPLVAAPAAATATAEEEPPVTFCGVMRAAAGGDKLRFLQVVLLAALNNAHFYLHFVWLGTYLAQLAPTPIPASRAFAVTSVAQACFILTNPVWGALGDRFGGAQHRLKWNLAGVALGCVLPPLLFQLLRRGDIGRDFAYAALSGLLMGFVMSGNYYAWVCEALHDAPARVMTTSVAYNLGAITGGAYPMLASALAESKVHTAPVLPVAFAALAGLPALIYLQQRIDCNGGKGGVGGEKEGFAALPQGNGRSGVGAQVGGIEMAGGMGGRGARVAEA